MLHFDTGCLAAAMHAGTYGMMHVVVAPAMKMAAAMQERRNVTRIFCKECRACTTGVLLFDCGHHCQVHTIHIY
jgi:hypothetical protein